MLFTPWTRCDRGHERSPGWRQGFFQFSTACKRLSTFFKRAKSRKNQGITGPSGPVGPTQPGSRKMHAPGASPRAPVGKALSLWRARAPGIPPTWGGGPLRRRGPWPTPATHAARPNEIFNFFQGQPVRDTRLANPPPRRPRNLASRARRRPLRPAARVDRSRERAISVDRRRIGRPGEHSPHRDCRGGQGRRRNGCRDSSAHLASRCSPTSTSAAGSMCRPTAAAAARASDSIRPGRPASMSRQPRAFTAPRRFCGSLAALPPTTFASC